MVSSNRSRLSRADSGPELGTDGSDDAQLILAIRERRPGAAMILYDRLEPFVERAVFRLLRERGADFDDLVQTTFERIVTTLLCDRFAAQCKLSTWATAIATHVAIDAIRSRIREHRRFVPADHHGATSQAEDRSSGWERLEARSEIRAVSRVLGEMNSGQAAALFLHDALGYSLSEVAELQGLSLAAAQSRLVRGRKDFLGRMPKGLGKGRTS